MKLSNQLTAVTPLSKILAGILFVTLPFLGFYLGMGYQKARNTNQTITAPVLPPNSPANDLCDKIPDPGTCLAYVPSYYFDQGTGNCKEFIWGGCEGVRPFVSFDKCQEACLGIHWVEFKADVIPFTVKAPSDWKKTESNIETTRNQKTVLLSSPDFSYEGMNVGKGFNFMVGPINDGMLTYQTFEDFAKGQKQDSSNYVVFINGIKWMKSNTSAVTLYNNQPLTIGIEANENQKEESTLLFKQILSTFKFLDVNDNTSCIKQWDDFYLSDLTNPTEFEKSFQSEFIEVMFKKEMTETDIKKYIQSKGLLIKFYTDNIKYARVIVEKGTELQWICRLTDNRSPHVGDENAVVRSAYPAGKPMPPPLTINNSNSFPAPYDKLQPPDNFKICDLDADCILGSNCGQVCFNKAYQNWYDQNVGSCMYKARGNLSCKCENNICIGYLQ
ncbi:MAG: Proteinase inhibitor I2 [Candidatus Roizmanbacteria bacterium GW2011_GWA2_37_7]|uniref:Proteinase inhibitor I2 n=1 Tax=Candidatus Roizmanbacteria bacterium GW2011_GWA2_37_7 TaxID=1618481 RepID=A0A0G0JM46_9BACT|nr:MAG: Proteinase inhibitor I2 [Candidatus Roizmanbacteria bacterium GW2011_GWA2_37_7]